MGNPGVPVEHVQGLGPGIDQFAVVGRGGRDALPDVQQLAAHLVVPAEVESVEQVGGRVGLRPKKGMGGVDSQGGVVDAGRGGIAHILGKGLPGEFELIPDVGLFGAFQVGVVFGQPEAGAQADRNRAQVDDQAAEQPAGQFFHLVWMQVVFLGDAIGGVEHAFDGCLACGAAADVDTLVGRGFKLAQGEGALEADGVVRAFAGLGFVDQQVGGNVAASHVDGGDGRQVGVLGHLNRITGFFFDQFDDFAGGLA